MENVSVVRIFTLSGINQTMNTRITLFSFTLLYYCVILFLNISLIMIIILDKNLHEPMYIFLCSFCINGLYGTTGFYPKFLLDLLSSSHEASYEGCLLQAFVLYSFACCELSNIALMAYDRYLAICRPLHYHSLMTKRMLSLLICFSWLTPLSIFGINVLLTSTVKLCGSKIMKLYCVNLIIFELACSDKDTVANSIMANLTTFIYLCHGLFIIWTYIHLVITSLKSKDDRLKFIQTCVPHLISLNVFIFVVVFDWLYMQFGSTDIPQNLKNLIAIKFMLFPPVVNPLIYGFKLTKIRHKILGIVYYKRK